MRGTALWHILAVQALVAARDEWGFTVIHKGGPFHKIILKLTSQGSDLLRGSGGKSDLRELYGDSTQILPNPKQYTVTDMRA